MKIMKIMKNMVNGENIFAKTALILAPLNK